MELKILLWEPPRALLTAVLPTLLRRLKTNWRKWGEEESEEYINSPLPEFISTNLFSDLNLPEIQLHLPDNRLEMMAISQGIREFAPGRVSKRYSVRKSEGAYWVFPGDLNRAEEDLVVSYFCEVCTDMGEIGYYIMETDEQSTVRAFRPTRIRLETVPKNISQTTNARLDWRNHLFTKGSGIEFEIPPKVFVHQIFKKVWFYLHTRNSPVSVRRFAIGSNITSTVVDSSTDSATEIHKYCGFIDDSGNKAAIGFEQEIDGIRIDCHVDDTTLGEALKGNGLKSCRVSYFLYSVKNDPELKKIANVFQLEWLAQIYLSLVTKKGCLESDSIRNAVQNCKEESPEEYISVMRELFQYTFSIKEDAEDDTVNSKLGNTLSNFFNNSAVLKRLSANAKCLYEKPKDEKWKSWLKQRILSTVGVAVMRACEVLAREHQSNDLILDIDYSVTQDYPENSDSWIWITETVLGGCGVIEEIYRKYTEDPLRFFMLIETELGHSDSEIIDNGLMEILSMTVPDNEEPPESELASVFRKFREASGHHETFRASEMLIRALENNNIFANRKVLSALNAHILRPGSSGKSDELLFNMMKEWRKIEHDYGIEVDARVFSYVASRKYSEEINTIVTNIGDSYESGLGPFSIIYSMLWPRGVYLREKMLETYNPYSELPKTDSKLLSDIFEREVTYIESSEPNWHIMLTEELCKNGTARLVSASKNTLQECILKVVINPIEIGCIFAYPYIVGTGCAGNGNYILFHLREAVF